VECPKVTSCRLVLIYLQELRLSGGVGPLHRMSARSINGVSRVTGRSESGRGIMKSWMQAHSVSGISRATKSRIKAAVNV